MRPKLTLALLLANVVLWSHFGYSEDKIRIGISAVSLGFLPTVVAERKGSMPSTASHPSMSWSPARSPRTPFFPKIWTTMSALAQESRGRSKGCLSSWS